MERDPTSGFLGLFSGHAGRMLSILALGGMASMTGRLLLSPLLPVIIDTLSISTAEAGLALSVMWGLAAIAHYPGGRMADALTRKTMIAVGFGVGIGGAVLLAATPNYAGLLAAAMLFGLGAGLFPPAAYAHVSELFDQRRGKAISVVSASVTLGGVVAGALATAALLVGSWRSAFVPIAATLGSLLLLFHVWSPEPYEIGHVSLSIRDTVGRLVVRPNIRLAIVALALFGFVWQGTTNFLPLFLQTEKGLSPALANYAFAGLFVVGALTTPVAGALGDRTNHALVAAGAALCGAVGLVVTVHGESNPAVLLGVGVLGVGLAGFWPVMYAYALGALPDASTSGDFGAIRSIHMGVASLGPLLVGSVVEHRSYTVAFGGLVGCLLVVLALTVVLNGRVAT